MRNRTKKWAWLMSGVTLNNVVKRYGDVQIVHRVDLEIKDGEFCVFVGPSGCCKSTLMRMVAGLEETTEGQIHIGSRDVARVDAAAELGSANIVLSGLAIWWREFKLSP